MEVQDSKGNQYGRVLAQVATIAEDPVKKNLTWIFLAVSSFFFHEAYMESACLQGDKLRWWSIYREPEHELVGRVQLFINYSTSVDENNLKVSYFDTSSLRIMIVQSIYFEIELKILMYDLAF